MLPFRARALVMKSCSAFPKSLTSLEPHYLNIQNTRWEWVLPLCRVAVSVFYSLMRLSNVEAEKDSYFRVMSESTVPSEWGLIFLTTLLSSFDFFGERHQSKSSLQFHINAFFSFLWEKHGSPSSLWSNINGLFLFFEKGTNPHFPTPPVSNQNSFNYAFR